MPLDRQTLAVWSPQLRTHRTVDVYLPPGYADERRRHPVVYMQDGQNLSDPATAFAGTWHLHETLERLVRIPEDRASDRRPPIGIEPIIIGVHHGGERRLAEFSPFPDPKLEGGAGARYVRFLTETLKPRIDLRYRTRGDRDSTAIVGSSMGGLISLYAFFAPPAIFGRIGALSPSIWFANRQILDFIAGAGAPRGRIYLDVGTAEGVDTLRNARLLAHLLRRKGYAATDSLRYIEASRHRHQESDWAKRLPGALEFLLRT